MFLLLTTGAPLALIAGGWLELISEKGVVMADYDEDAVVEAMARAVALFQPQIDALNLALVRKAVKRTVDYGNGEVEVWEITP